MVQPDRPAQHHPEALAGGRGLAQAPEHVQDFHRRLLAISLGIGDRGQHPRHFVEEEDDPLPSTRLLLDQILDGAGQELLPVAVRLILLLGELDRADSSAAEQPEELQEPPSLLLPAGETFVDLLADFSANSAAEWTCSRSSDTGSQPTGGSASILCRMLVFPIRRSASIRTLFPSKTRQRWAMNGSRPKISLIGN